MAIYEDGIQIIMLVRELESGVANSELEHAVSMLLLRLLQEKRSKSNIRAYRL